MISTVSSSSNRYNENELQKTCFFTNYYNFEVLMKKNKTDNFNIPMSNVLAVFGATGQQGGSVINYALNDPKLSQEYKIRAITVM